jgi:hypothetical protein
MAEENCANCPLRARYDKNPRSLLSRFWRWHINFCPGWKKYFSALPADEKGRVAEQYKFTKYQ